MSYNGARAAVQRTADQAPVLRHSAWLDAYKALRRNGFTGEQAVALADGGYRIIGWAVVRP